MTAEDRDGWEPWHRWPNPKNEIQYGIRCGCGWTWHGPAQRLGQASSAHDDSPNSEHIVSIYERRLPRG